MKLTGFELWSGVEEMSCKIILPKETCILIVVSNIYSSTQQIDIVALFHNHINLCTVWSFAYLRAAEAILLGFQHYLVMLGTTVIIPTALVPQMGGGNVCLISEYHN